ncbi:MAG: hypothetical protein NTX25_01400, partial [Proteobacteria bacterium]|nr:hypothetical protein [Pseudomonadota bacterium]
KVLTEDTKVYRYWVEGFNGPKGHWVTRNKVNDPLSELALPHSGPYKEQEWIIPKGTEILEGMAAPNFKQLGGAGQIFVPNPGALQ